MNLRRYPPGMLIEFALPLLVSLGFALALIETPGGGVLNWIQENVHWFGWTWTSNLMGQFGLLAALGYGAALANLWRNRQPYNFTSAIIWFAALIASQIPLGLYSFVIIVHIGVPSTSKFIWGMMLVVMLAFGAMAYYWYQKMIADLGGE